MEGKTGKMIYLDPKISPEKENLPISEKVSYLYQEFLKMHDANPANLVCYVRPTENFTEHDHLISPEGIRIMASNYILNNHYYFVPQH